MTKSNFRLLSVCAFLAFLFFLTQVTEAQQEVTVGKDFGAGARAMGMGGAFISVADDFTAIYWNPAGLSQIKRMEFFGALSHERVETETTYFGSLDSTFASNTRPNSFGIVLPVPTYRGGLAFAFGVNREQGFDLRTVARGFNSLSVEEDPEFGLLSINELTKESGGIYSWNFGAAVDIAPGVSLGGALSFLTGDYTYELSLKADDTESLDSELAGFEYADVIDTDYFGVEGRIGLLARVAEWIRLGVTMNIPLDFSADEYWSQDTYYLYDDETYESEYDEGTFSYDISRPFRFGGGVSLHPIPGAIISTSATYTDWTQTKYSEPPSEDVSNEDFIEDYRPTLRIGVGGEYTIPGAGVRIRAGYLRDPLPYTPEGTSIDTDRQFVTAGIGMLLNGIFSLDVTYMRGFWKESTENVVKDRNSSRIFISAGYRF